MGLVGLRARAMPPGFDVFMDGETSQEVFEGCFDLRVHNLGFRFEMHARHIQALRDGNIDGACSSSYMGVS